MKGFMVTVIIPMKTASLMLLPHKVARLGLLLSVAKSAMSKLDYF
jgi:hypothetical protein